MKRFPSIIALPLLMVSLLPQVRAAYSDYVLSLEPSLYYPLDETVIEPGGALAGSPVRNLATDGLLHNAAHTTKAGSTVQSTGVDDGAIPGNAGIQVNGWAVHGQSVTASGTTPFSLNFWVKPDGFAEGNYPALFQAGNSIAGGPVTEVQTAPHGYAVHTEVGGENNLLIGLDGLAGNLGKVVLATYGTRYCASQAGLKPGGWNAIGLTYDGLNLRLYINGVPDVVFGVAGRTFSSGNGKYFLLGNEYVTGNFPYSGGLDDFAYWNGRVLSDEQMRRLGQLGTETTPPSTDLPSQEPATLSLDGSWQFRLDPKNEGEAGNWSASGVGYPGEIQVPGNWQAQGFGEPSGIVKHNYLGKAWYRRTVRVPASWKNHRVVLRLDQVMNYGDVWLNGRKLGRVRTFVSPHEFDVTDELNYDGNNTLAVMVDSLHTAELSYIGMMQFLNKFGGITSHVNLIALPDPAISEAVATLDLASKQVRLRVTLDRKESGPAWQGTIRVRITPAGGGESHEATTAVNFPKESLAVSTDALSVAMPDLHAWSPEDPFLYDVNVSLSGGNGLLAEKTWRTGFREIKADADDDIVINGLKTYIRGCGYDSLEPVFGTPPPDKAVYKERLQHLKDLGFNAVRFLSHTPLREFFEAADEVGMLVQAEGEWFMAYSPMPPGVGALLTDQVPRLIKEHGQHPSWYAFSCFNEAYDLNTDPVKRAYVDAAYKTLRALKPDLLFMPSDGVGDAWPTDVITEPHEIRKAIALLDQPAGRSESVVPQQVFHGGLVGVAIFKQALTDEDMKSLAAAAQSQNYYETVTRLKPSAYWPLDEISPGTVRDASGNGNDGRHEPGTIATQLATPAHLGRAMDSGSEAGVSLADVASRGFPSGDAPFSTSFWVKPEAFGAGNFGTFLSWGAAEINRGLMVCLDGEGGEGKLLIGRYGNNILKSSQPLVASQWTHVGLTYDGQQLKLFMDGKLVGEVAQKLTIAPRDARIGRLIQKPLHEAADFRKPYLWHEYNNTYIAPLPDLEIENKLTGSMTQTAVLAPHRQRMESYGLLSRYPELRERSFDLYREFVKQAFESLRRMPRIDGFAWWFVSDLPGGVETDVTSFGVLDMVYQPEKFPDTAWFRNFNSGSVLLIDADIDARVLRTSEAKPIKVLLSHFGAPPVEDGQLAWKLTADGRTIQEGVVPNVRAAMGSITGIASLNLGPFDLPEATALRLEVSLESSVSKQSNAWKFWAFPDKKPGLPKAAILNLTGDPALDARYGASGTLNLSDAALAIASSPTPELLEYIEQGGKVIFLESDAQRAAPLLQVVKPLDARIPSESSFLRQPGALTYWPRTLRCNAQLIETHPMLAGFPQEGFSDFQLSRLFGDSVPSVSFTSKTSVARGKVRPVIWNLDLAPWSEDPSPWGFAFTWNGLLSECRLGQGRAILCNLWLLDGIKRGLPEAGYLLDCLVDYQLTGAADTQLPTLTPEEADNLFQAK